MVVLDTRERGLAVSSDPDRDDFGADVEFERAVEAAASIVTCLQRQRRPVECCTSAGTRLTRGATDTGPTVLDRLATVAAGDPDELAPLLGGLRRRPPELVVFVTARLDAGAVAALRACEPRSAVLVVLTGGDPAPRDLRAVDARVQPFSDAWRAATSHTHTRTAPAWTSAAPSLRPVRSPR